MTGHRTEQNGLCKTVRDAILSIVNRGRFSLQGFSARP